MRTFRWQSGLAFVAGLFWLALVYGHTLNHPFHYDDKHSIKYNPHIRSLSNASSFFTDLGSFSSDSRGRMFRPVLLLSYALNYSWHGQNTEGYRIVNIVLLAMSGAIIFSVLAKQYGNLVIAGSASIFLLMHPTRTELINLISSRSDLLVALCVLSAIYLSVSGGSKRFRFATYGFYVVGLLCKSIAVVLPVVLLLKDLSRCGIKKILDNVSLHATLAAITTGYVCFLVWIGFISDSLSKAPRDFGVQFLTYLKTMVYYLWLFVNPVALSVEHEFMVTITPSEVILEFLFVISLVICACRWRSHPLSWAIGWFAITILPVTLFPLNLLVSERRLYLPSVGLSVGLAWCFWTWANYHRVQCFVGIASLCVVFSALSWQRNTIWETEISLWEDAVRKAPRSDRARVNLAIAYHQNGREPDALMQLRHAVEIHPKNSEAWAEIGSIFLDKGDHERAEEAFIEALNHGPWMSGVHYNLANLYQQQGRLEEAIVRYTEALNVEPGYAQAHNNLGQAYEGTGQHDRAIFEYKTAVRADSSLAPAWYNLAVLYERDGHKRLAKDAYYKAFVLLGLEEWKKHADSPKFRRLAKSGFERMNP